MTARRRFDATEASVAAARRFVTGVITGTHVDVRDSVSLMVSELATHALVHASSGFVVVVARSDRSVVVAVSDGGDGTPVLQSPESDEPHGRGLRIVDALSDEWGISSPSDRGKTVWFRMGLEPSGAGAPADGTAHAPAARTGGPAGPAAASPAVPVAQPEGTPRVTASHGDERPGPWSPVGPNPPTPGHHRDRSIPSPAGG